EQRGGAAVAKAQAQLAAGGEGAEVHLERSYGGVGRHAELESVAGVGHINTGGRVGHGEGGCAVAPGVAGGVDVELVVRAGINELEVGDLRLDAELMIEAGLAVEAPLRPVGCSFGRQVGGGRSGGH